MASPFKKVPLSIEFLPIKWRTSVRFFYCVHVTICWAYTWA
ncbi:MAG: hypothetical protein OFPI_12700 [Osedax symbiont Rs2]|nr:MAG: hypothetical protein OFPI_12700 [Osedax symbiont Rs2]